MTPLLVLLGAVVAAGGVVAVCAREPRFATLGAFVAIVAGAYVADPVPGLAALAARLVAAVLAGYLIWIALRRAPAKTSGWHAGWPGATGLAAVAFAAGWLAAGTVAAVLAATAGEGPSAVGVAPALVTGSPVSHAALGAAFALLALSAAPVLVAHDSLRLGLGLMLLVAAAGLVRNALAAGSDGAVELAFAILVAAAGAATAGLVAASLRRHHDFELRSGRGREAPIHHRTLDEAHPDEVHPGEVHPGEVEAGPA